MKYTITIEKATTKDGNVFDSLLVYVGSNESQALEVFNQLSEAFIKGNTFKKSYMKLDMNFMHLYIEVSLWKESI